MGRDFLHFTMHVGLLALCLALSLWGGLNIGSALNSAFWGVCVSLGQFILMYGSLLAILDAHMFYVVFSIPVTYLTIAWLKILQFGLTEVLFAPKDGEKYELAMIKEYHNWAKINCRGPVIYYLGRIFFWKKTDVVAFKLRFSGETPFEWEIK